MNEDGQTKAIIAKLRLHVEHADRHEQCILKLDLDAAIRRLTALSALYEALTALHDAEYESGCDCDYCSGIDAALAHL